MSYPDSERDYLPPTIDQVHDQLDREREARRALAADYAEASVKNRKLSELITLIDESIAIIVSSPHDYTTIHAIDTYFQREVRSWSIGVLDEDPIMILADGTLLYSIGMKVVIHFHLDLEELTIEQIDFIIECIQKKLAAAT